MWRRLGELTRDAEGAILTEYVAVTGFVAIVTLPALFYAAVAVTKNFAAVRNFILFPFP